MKHAYLRFYQLLFLLFVTLSMQTAMAQGTINGTVTDENDEALPGASAYIKNTTNGNITDINGQFSLSVDAGNATVVISFTGYTTVERAISVEDGQSYDLAVKLTPDVVSLDAVVVTGTFAARSERNSPISLTRLNSRQLQDMAASSQADIIRGVPGITAEGGGGEIASNVFVRGLPSAGQYQFTPIQIDGMPVLSTFGLNSSAHDVYFRNDLGFRNLEFVRGGASTLFGAGSVAGIINYTSITGSETPENKIQMEWAEGGRSKLDFLTAGEIADDLYYAVSGTYRYDEGPLETGLITRGYQLRGNIKKVFNNGNSTLTVSGQLIDDQVQFFLPFPLNNNGGEFERPVGNDGETIYTLQTSAATDFSFDTPNGRFESPVGDGVTTDGGYFMVDLQHAFGDNWSLSSKVKRAKYDHWFNLFLDGDGVVNVPEDQASFLTNRAQFDNNMGATFTYADTGQPLAAGDIVFQNRILDRQRPMEEMVGEFNLTKDAGNHSITFGTFLSDTRAEDNNWISTYLGDFSNSPRMVNLSYVDGGGNQVAYSTDGFVSGNQTANRYHQSSKIAFYAADQISMSNFNLDIGFRWERARGRISRETGVGTNTFNKGTVTASDFAIALAGLYKLSETSNLYANFSKGYFFPALRSLGFLSPGVPGSYESEKIYQGEIGWKYSDSKFSATAAAFYVTLQDRRNVDFINDPNNPGNIIEDVSIQSTRTNGVELSANYILGNGFSAYGNVTLQDHEFTKVEGNPEQEGNKLRRQPTRMGLAGLRYQGGNFDADVSGNFLGSKFSNDANTVELDGYNIFRVNMGYTFALGENNETMRLGLSVFNLFDSEGITEGSPRQGNSQVGSGDFFTGRPILPRRIFLRLAFNF